MENFNVHRNFYPKSKELRAEFESHFKNAKSTDAKRFVWDFWYDEDQYHLIRTPAFYYFSKKSYQNFHSHLVQWGRENLGCHDISPPWLSYYVDGCFQNLHSDVPHGPWAFVYSLTPNKKEFRGGETLILKNQTLNYWSKFMDQKDHEFGSFVDRIPSRMNELVVFDPRFPHGVTEVKGTRDPLKSRLVIHGWFVNPRPYVVGGLSTTQVQKSLQPQFEQLNSILSEIDLMNGTLSCRLQIRPTGSVQSYTLISNSVLSVIGNESDQKYLQKELKTLFSKTEFPKTKTASVITIPLIFK
ncbi:MAG: hypothetical protein A2622_03875 [Bdellovibrionales bacterium RIFCSPHIGHO2_01_FULL_40_29]|nr:MAG: hypothetical protein A2622_03875 [Bdellovibrionales bacterium RIFCSPHIGHO2_01_FULL_40_29]OFZ35345.1 MAG: hypothetical protein A3D17_08155 [Bdellovibrionales bacterium RIFCSPHIGHO2_02_FULL_40_15]